MNSNHRKVEDKWLKEKSRRKSVWQKKRKIDKRKYLIWIPIRPPMRGLFLFLLSYFTLPHLRPSLFLLSTLVLLFLCLSLFLLSALALLLFCLSFLLFLAFALLLFCFLLFPLPFWGLSTFHSGLVFSLTLFRFFPLISHIVTRHAFPSILSCNSFIYLQSAFWVKRCFFLPRENDKEDDWVSLVRVLLKKSRKGINKRNWKKLNFQLMVGTKKEETVWLIFCYCTCNAKMKLNTNWLIEILLKSFCMMNGIVSITALHQVNNFWPSKKHIRLLAKRVTFFTKNFYLRELKVWLREIWRSKALSKVKILLEKN